MPVGLLATKVALVINTGNTPLDARTRSVRRSAGAHGATASCSSTAGSVRSCAALFGVVATSSEDERRRWLMEAATLAEKAAALAKIGLGAPRSRGHGAALFGAARPPSGRTTPRNPAGPGAAACRARRCSAGRARARPPAAWSPAARRRCRRRRQLAGRRPTSISSGGWPFMPSDVVFTSKVGAVERLVALVPALDGDAPAVVGREGDAEIDRALLCVRLTRRSSGTPAATRVATTARAAPPAPSTVTGPAAACQPGAPCFRASRSRSRRCCGLPACRRACLITVFTAPMCWASGSMRSSSGMMSILCGRVRLQPRALGVRFRKAMSSSSAARLGSTGRRPVVAVDAVLLQPEAVQRRRRANARPASRRWRRRAGRWLRCSRVS